MGRSVQNEVVGEGYRWTCPFCGESTVNKSTGEFGWRSAETALGTHLVASDGAEHGPRYEFPREMDELELADHVERAVAGEPT